MNWQDTLTEFKKYLTEFGIHIISAIAIIVIGFWIAKTLTKVFTKVLTKKSIDATLIHFLASALKFVLYLFVIIAAVGQLGIETTSFIAALGAAGLAIGLALQGSLSNVAAGAMLIILRQIKVGQFVETNGVTGTVEKVGIFNTTLITIDNKVIYIPNSKLINDNIINYTEKEIRRIDLVFSISYKDDIDKAKNIIKNIIEADSLILNEPKPIIVVGELADNSVNIFTRPWVNTQDFFDVRFRLIESVKKKFDEEKITIPFPQRDVHLHQN